jgi:hypothetical protein
MALTLHPPGVRISRRSSTELVSQTGKSKAELGFACGLRNGIQPRMKLLTR